MYVRVKSSPNSPRKSVQIVHSYREGNKVRQKIIKHIGVANSDEELEELKLYATKIKLELEQQNSLPIYSPSEIASIVDRICNNIKDNKINKKSSNNKDKIKKEEESIDNIQEYKRYSVNLLDLVEIDREIKGIHDIYGKLYDELGFNRVLLNPSRNKKSVEILKDITLARVANADSKRATRDYLEDNFGVKLNLESIYKMMDKLDDKAIKRLQDIVFNQTKSLFNDKIDILYFDATTIYFESFNEDNLREKGFSKDGKHKEVQIVLALMVTKQGLPIGYKIFKGSTYDGHTIIPTLKELKRDFNVDKVICVADSGMLSKANLKELEEFNSIKDNNSNNFNISYIVGARVKNMNKDIIKEILDLTSYQEYNSDIKYKEIKLEDNKRLILTYSKKRAKKDRLDRQKAIDKLRLKLSKDSSLKSNLSNSRYRKFITIKDSNSTNSNKCNLKVSINEDKIKEDEKFDGIKGVITNDISLTIKDIIEQYSNLWIIEESFRINKHDLKIRPIFHFKESRIKAHIAICFMAYTLIRHLEYRVKLQYKKLSPQKIKKLLLSVQVSILKDTKSNRVFLFPSNYDNEVKKIYKIMEVPILNRAIIIKE